MKIEGIKLNFGIDVGSVDIDLKDCLELTKENNRHREHWDDTERTRRLEEMTVNKVTMNAKEVAGVIVNKIGDMIKEAVEKRMRQ